MMENSPIIINRYRTATIALGYTGDSVLNSVGDIASFLVGFWIARNVGLWWSVALPLNEVNVPITGLCAVCPEVVLADRMFCFTGASTKATRKQFQRLVEARGGRFWPRVTKEVNYLVIGCDGNPCWAFSCYGRKVEQAITLRKEGCQLLLVHEHDFFDAIA